MLSESGYNALTSIDWSVLIPDKRVKWSVVGYFYAADNPDTGENRSRSCQHCGKGGIRHVYTIKSNLGQTMEVGSTCVMTVPGMNTAQAKGIETFRKRATREWNANKELRHEDEKRGDFIERRIGEMFNAVSHYSRFQTIAKQYTYEVWRLHPDGKDYRYGGPKQYEDRYEAYRNWRDKNLKPFLEMYGLNTHDVARTASDFRRRYVAQVKYSA